jgi:hypothetical protein
MPTVYLALIIPIIVTGVFYFFRKSEFSWWEFFIPIGSVLIAIVISKAIIDHTTVSFDEWWGSSVTSVYEEEPYNYWHSEMCSKTVPCGSHTDSNGNTVTDYCTEWYDCSHQDDVGPSWSAETNIGESFRISEKQHDEIIKLFKTNKTIINTHKNHTPSDYATSSRGTKFEDKRVGNISYVYQTDWNGSDETRKPYVSKHTYINKVKASDLSIFNIKIVDDKQADTLGLFKYPSRKDTAYFNSDDIFYFPTILGSNVSKETQEKFKRLNGKFGPTNQLRLWVLIFENKPMSIADYQENYWVKGNKNELVLCIGKKGDEITWSKAFSWSHSSELTAAVQNEVLNLYTYKDSVIKRNIPAVVPTTKEIKNKVLGKAGEKLPNILPLPQQVIADSIIKVKSAYPILTEKTWDELYNYLNNNLDKFKRRPFKEFSYLTVEPSTGSLIFIYILAFVISLGVNLWVINNEIK